MVLQFLLLSGLKSCYRFVSVQIQEKVLFHKKVESAAETASIKSKSCVAKPEDEGGKKIQISSLSTQDSAKV